MRKIDWIEENLRDLNQNSNYMLYGLINNNSVIGYGFITCKDYFNEMFSYILHNKFKDNSQYGMTIGTWLDVFKDGRETFEIGIKVNSKYPLAPINSLETTLDYINTFKTDLANAGHTEFSEGFTAELTEDCIVLTINKSICNYTFRLSLLLGVVRDVMNITGEINYNKLNGYPNMNVLLLLNLLEEEKKFLSLDKFEDISICHNSSGFRNSVNVTISKHKLEYVYVYGTLRKGLYNHYLLQDSMYIATKELDRLAYTGKYMELINLGGFPGIILSNLVQEDYKRAKEAKPIIVECYLVNQQTMSRLDSLEGYRKNTPTEGMYNKVQINGKFNIYTYNGGNNGRIIECGDYIKFLNEKTKAF